MSQLFISRTLEEDLDMIVALESQFENSKFIIPNSKNEHFKILHDEDNEHLLLKTADDLLVGYVILSGIADVNRTIEFRRIVIKDKDKGYGKMAIRAIKKHCFSELNCHRLWLDVMENNERAIHIYLSEGFKQEGILRDRLLINEKYISLIVMSILEPEYQALPLN